MVDSTISNLTITDFVWVNNAVVEDFSVTNCILELCVEDLSVEDLSIAGILSANDEVINGDLQIRSFNTPGVIHNDAFGNLSSSLVVNADVSSSAGITDTKLATISTAGKVANSATTATSVNTPNAIVARDGSGNFSAGTITASLAGNATTATTAITATNANNFTGLLSGDVTGTQSATVVSAVGGQTAINVAAGTVLANAATSADTANAIIKRSASGGFSTSAISVADEVVSNSLTITPFSTAGIVHNNASGVLSSSLIVNADISPSASIADTKLATISTAGKVANSATTATTANTPNTIVLRDGSGNISATTITGSLSGNASTSTSFTGPLNGDVIGTQSATVVSLVGGQTATNVAAATVLANAATSADTANTIVKRSSTGGISTSAISVVDEVVSNSLTLTPLSTAGVVHNNASGLLSSSLVVNTDIADGTISNAKLANISSNNTSGNIVVRDGSGNFAINMISIAGAVSNPTDAATKAYVDAAISTGLAAKNPARVVGTTNQPLTGLLTIDGIVLSVNDRVLLTGQTNQVENGLWLVAIGSWSRPTDFAIGSTAGQAYVLITSGLTYGASSWLCNAPSAIVGTDPLSFALFTLPDSVTGANVGTGTGLIFKNKTSNTINLRTLLADSHILITNNADDITLGIDATSANTANTVVTRDMAGDFSAGTITANLIGNATGATNFSGALNGDVIGTQSSTVVNSIGGQTAANVATATVLANAATSANTASTIVKRSSAGGFSASEISIVDEIVSNSLIITPFSSSGIVHNNASGLLSSSLIVNEDVSPSAAIVDTKLATISTAGKVANSATTATSANTPSTIIMRDGSGDFSAGTITANLIGNATTATSTTSFSGSLSGDVTGIQGATVVSLVGGQTATNVAAATVLANAATSANTANAIVRRSATGGFSASAISVADEVISNSLTMTPFNSAGIVHNNAVGLLSSSLIVNADIDPAAAIVDTKLATISTAGKVANSATTATTSNIANTIVLRDGSGNFTANMITIAGTTTNPSDVATKSYVDSLLGSGGTGAFVAKTPVNLVSTTNISSLLGGLLIDGVTLLAGNRVLLVGQTNQKNNGIWNAQLGSWTRPSDFANGSTAGQAYVLVNSGLAYAGSSWVCVTPDAVVGTDNIGFIQYSAPGSIIGANVGIGVGQIFQNQVGNVLNFKTILAGSHITVTNNPNDITISTDGVSASVPTTLIARDTLGDFSANTANLTGSLNLPVSSSSTIGSITKGGVPFLHNFGVNNTCVGSNAGNFIMSGTGGNSCFGTNALLSNTTGSLNTALGYNALPLCTTGSNNIAIGANAASSLINGANNICIGSNVISSGESAVMRIGSSGIHTKCFMAGIRGITTGNPDGIAILIDSTGQLGTISSSEKVKHDITDMGSASDDVLNLRPVTFVYNGDATNKTQYGLIAEEVERVFPAIVVKNEDNEPVTIQYHILPVLLLNEIKKQRQTIEEMQSIIAQLFDKVEYCLNNIRNTSDCSVDA